MRLSIRAKTYQRIGIRTLLAIPMLASVMLFTVGQGQQPETDTVKSQSTATPDTKLIDLVQGDSLKGWQHSGNWTLENGVISRTGKGGSLTYIDAKVPDDFELQFEWKVAPGSNSGIYYRPGQYEYQILDNDKHRDGKNPRTSAASLYFCMPPSHDVTASVGQWNQGRIVCKGSVIQHWLNGQPVVSFDYSDPRWHEEVELLRRRGGTLDQRDGRLSLQDHGDPVWYRNLRWREIPPLEEIETFEVEPAEIDDMTRDAELKKVAGIEARRNKKP
ncbi:MAG: DUF1080 domain-containing protein [Planctomycetota bacterium]